eukprot:m.95853 g.95853  ORF g.95853 m.95853 type:complete len:369 (-) comp26849_c1_seq1:38-1144(-)
MATAAAEGDDWFTIENIRNQNVDLDDCQEHRAFLPPRKYCVAEWNALVDYLQPKQRKKGKKGIVKVTCPKLVRLSTEAKLNPTTVQPYTTDFSIHMLQHAVFSGFFPFGSEFHFKGQPLEQRSLLNLELCGPDKTTGRVLLLEASSTLTVGKRSLEFINKDPPHLTQPLTFPPTCAASTVPYSGSKRRYVFSVNKAFSQTWERVVAQHGVDWCGFTRVRDAFSRLHACGVTTVQASDDVSVNVQVVSLELWDSDSGDLVSGEIGFLVGACYCCLSLFAQEDKYPRSCRTRAQCAVLWLAKAGVELFDVGTTAEYYCHLHGFSRYTRRSFVDLWRKHRAVTLHRYVWLDDEERKKKLNTSKNNKNNKKK